jgi:outer membrane protein insertion porin family
LYSTSFNTFEFLLGWLYDSRNRALFPTRGMRHRLVASATVPGSDVEYYTVNYNFAAYQPLPIFNKLVASLSLDLGFGDAIGDTTSVPPYKRFFGGGPDTVRGYSENQLGPIDSFGNPYGGNLLVAGQAEIILPIPEKWSARARFSLFYDFGNVFDTGGVQFFDKLGDPIEYQFDASEIKQSAGIAAEWLAPLGLFRFSFGFPINANDGTTRFFGDETERFQFSIGGAF